jgi:glycosyltransferase involved in cell wall biosynthesis
MFLARTLVLIPALNEAASVAETIHAWQHLGAKCVRVIDNGSTDATAESASAAGAEVVSEPKRGYGAAACRGLQEWPSNYEWVLFSSADGSDQLTVVELAAWQQVVDSGADLLIGDRTALAESRRHLKVSQRLGNWVCVMAIAAGWGRRFHDMGSLRLVRRSALERMQLQNRGFGWNVEMQVRALELGLRIVEMPVGYYPRFAGESKISGSIVGTFRAGGGIVRMLIHLYRLKRAHQRAAAISPAVPA